VSYQLGGPKRSATLKQNQNHNRLFIVLCCGFDEVVWVMSESVVGGAGCCCKGGRMLPITMCIVHQHVPLLSGLRFLNPFLFNQFFLISNKISL